MLLEPLRLAVTALSEMCRIYVDEGSLIFEVLVCHFPAMFNIWKNISCTSSGEATQLEAKAEDDEKITLSEQEDADNWAREDDQWFALIGIIAR